MCEAWHFQGRYRPVGHAPEPTLSPDRGPTMLQYHRSLPIAREWELPRRLMVARPAEHEIVAHG